jgi:ankyrin repeat protein
LADGDRHVLKWLKSLGGGKGAAGKSRDKTLIRTLAAGISTVTGHRRQRVLHAYVQSASSSVAGTRAMVASGVPVDAINHDGDTPFIIAVRKNREPLARTLAELGADVNHKNRLHRTALHEAAQQGSLTLVKLCLTYRAALDAQDANGNTPVHLAAARAQPEVVEFLIRAGARPDTQNRTGHTAFAVAPEPLQRKMTTWWLETTSRIKSGKK